MRVSVFATRESICGFLIAAFFAFATLFFTGTAAFTFVAGFAGASVVLPGADNSDLFAAPDFTVAMAGDLGGEIVERTGGVADVFAVAVSLFFAADATVFFLLAADFVGCSSRSMVFASFSTAAFNGDFAVFPCLPAAATTAALAVLLVVLLFFADFASVAPIASCPR